MATITLAKVNQFLKSISEGSPIGVLSSEISLGTHLLKDGHVFHWSYGPKIHVIFNANSKMTLYWPAKAANQQVVLTPEGEGKPGRAFIGDNNTSMDITDSDATLGNATVTFLAVKGLATQFYGNHPPGPAKSLTAFPSFTSSQRPPQSINTLMNHVGPVPTNLMLFKPMTKSKKYGSDIY